MNNTHTKSRCGFTEQVGTHCAGRYIQYTGGTQGGGRLGTQCARMYSMGRQVLNGQAGTQWQAGLNAQVVLMEQVDVKGVGRK